MEIERQEIERPEIGWARAIATGLAILVLGLAVAVAGADEIIKQVTSVSRNVVEYLVTAYFVACVVGAAWLLRRLQRRGIL